MDHETPEMIAQQMNSTRQSITDKVAALESQMVETFDHASAAIQNAAQSVKSAVSDSMECVTDKVKESIGYAKTALDLNHHIRRQPWAMVAGATLSGIVVGYLFGPNHDAAKSSTSSQTDRRRQLVLGESNSRIPAAPGIFDALIERVRTEARTLGDNLIITLSNSLRNNLNKGVENLVTNTLTIDRSRSERPSIDADVAGP